MLSLCYVPFIELSLAFNLIEHLAYFGSEKVTFKMNWRFFKLCHIYSVVRRKRQM